MKNWCREGGSNPHDRKGRRILSPSRTPITDVASVVCVLPKRNCVRKCVNLHIFDPFLSPSAPWRSFLICPGGVVRQNSSNLFIVVLSIAPTLQRADADEWIASKASLLNLRLVAIANVHPVLIL